MKSKHMPQLSEIERKLIVTLAEQGPLSGYDFHLGGKRERGSRKALMSSGYWEKTKKQLGPQGFNLIQNVELHGRPKSGSRHKDLYWLTEEGIAYAILNDANLTLLLENVKKVNPEDVERKASLIEILSKFPQEVRKALLSMAIQGSKIGYEKLLTVTVLGSQTELNPEKLNREMVGILRKYPEVHEFYRQALKRSLKQVRHLVKIAEGVSHE